MFLSLKNMALHKEKGWEPINSPRIGNLKPCRCCWTTTQITIHHWLCCLGVLGTESPHIWIPLGELNKCGWGHPRRIHNHLDVVGLYLPATLTYGCVGWASGSCSSGIFVSGSVVPHASSKCYVSTCLTGEHCYSQLPQDCFIHYHQLGFLEHWVCCTCWVAPPPGYL